MSKIPAYLDPDHHGWKVLAEARKIAQQRMDDILDRMYKDTPYQRPQVEIKGGTPGDAVFEGKVTPEELAEEMIKGFAPYFNGKKGELDAKEDPA